MERNTMNTYEENTRDHEDSLHETTARRIANAMGLTVTAAFKGDRCPPWSKPCDHIHGDRYRVTLRFADYTPAACPVRNRRVTPEYHARTGCRHTRPRLSFDFWNSQHDAQTETRPGFYDILSCVSSDAFMPTDPDEVVEELGEMPPSQAIAAAKFAARLQAFFTEDELTALGEIR